MSPFAQHLLSCHICNMFAFSTSPNFVVSSIPKPLKKPLNVVLNRTGIQCKKITMHQNHLQIAILRYEKITELHLNVWTLPPYTLKLASATTSQAQK